MANYLSTSEYARVYGMSRMHVTRLIHAGKISAKKVGKSWMIDSDKNGLDQINFEKTSSIQKWNKLINKEFHKNLKIEGSKDREIIYSKMHSLGLPHERFMVFSPGHFPTKKEFEIAVGRMGTPYWISCPPDAKYNHLDRQSKLRIYDVNTGWKFINKLPEKEKYKIIICETADDPLFKGTVLISPSGNGFAEFITGDRHYIMTRGFTMTDPMLFNQESIKRFSKTVQRSKQKLLYSLIRDVYGHMEFQYGKIQGKNIITFFDYSDQEGYIEIDNIWGDLITYFKTKQKRSVKYIYGLPASLGKAIGKVVILHHDNIGMYPEVEKGSIIVSDTTTPEMTPIMAKAAAIVTDLGGITSHAAIVCRELKIPAIVGTRNATEKLRTGDTVSVDADRGEVKIIS